MEKINKLILISILIIVSTNVFSQVNNTDTIHFLRFKATERNSNIEIFLIEFCILENDSIKSCSYSGFDGHSLLVFHSKDCNLDSVFLRIRDQRVEASKNNNNFIKILLKDVELNKKIVLGDIKIVLFNHEIMTKEEYKKYKDSLEVMPGRKLN